jgi:hypothetical protein
MRSRPAILVNFRWKFAALVLAIFVWFVINLAIERGAVDSNRQIYRSLPVRALTQPGDDRAFQINPAMVDDILISTSRRDLTTNDIQLFVDLTEPLEVDGATRPVLVHAPAGVEVIRIYPPRVLVERLVPVPTGSLTNSLRPGIQ